MKKLEETRNCFIMEIDQNELMTKKHKKPKEYFIILPYTINTCVLIKGKSNILTIGKSL